MHMNDMQGPCVACCLSTWGACAGGKKVIVFGGEGYNLDDGGSPPCVYILDVDTLTWHRKATYAEAPEHSPGARSLHVTTVRVLSWGSRGFV
jgi:hypothetical protein